MRALSHKIRTPLSVIQNELTYIKTKVPEGEWQMAIDACGRISDILGKASKKITYKADFQDLNIEQFKQLLSANSLIKLESLGIDPGSTLKLDPNLFECAWECLLEFLESRRKLSGDFEVKLEKADSGLQISLSSPFQAYMEGKTLPPEGYSSLCEFSYLCLDNDSVLLPLADTIISEHGWSTNIQLLNKVIHIRFLITSSNG